MGIRWSMSSSSQKPQEELFTNLPREMTKEILRRLPIRSIIVCKRVCKSWRHLIEEGELVPLHSRKPCPAFAIVRQEIYAVLDEAFKPLFGFRLPSSHRPFSGMPYFDRVVIDSLDGLLLVWHGCNNSLFIVNPMTRENVTLPMPMRMRKFKSVFGFGVRKIGGQYKVLCGTRESSPYYLHTLGGEGEGQWNPSKKHQAPLYQEYQAPIHDPLLRFLMEIFIGFHMTWREISLCVALILTLNSLPLFLSHTLTH